MHVFSVIGARPQFIKAAVLSRALRETCQETLLHTGQHYDDCMSDRFFRELGLPDPDYQLEVGSGTHAEQTAQMLTGIEAALLRDKPDVVLVYGDTNSTAAGALAAAKLGVPVAHVEAGLRSFNRSMPEELNRVVTDHLSTFLFCPTQHAARLLKAEGITSGVHVVGDVMFEALNDAVSRTKDSSRILAQLGLRPGSYLLVTLHRAENTDDPGRLDSLLAGLEATKETVIFPVHPRTQRVLEQLGPCASDRIRRIEPVGYFDMVALEQGARLILTDSGGIQKEAYWLGVPCVTLRDETEWTETVDAGWNVLTGLHVDRIVKAVRTFEPPTKRPAVCADASASKRIVALLESGRC